MQVIEKAVFLVLLPMLVSTPAAFGTAEPLPVTQAEIQDAASDEGAIENTTEYYDMRRCFTRMRYLGVYETIAQREEKAKNTSTHCRTMLKLNNGLAGYLLDIGVVKSYKRQWQSESVPDEADSYYDLKRCVSRTRYFTFLSRTEVGNQQILGLTSRCRKMIKGDNALLENIIVGGLKINYHLGYQRPKENS